MDFRKITISINENNNSYYENIRADAKSLKKQQTDA